MLKRLLPLLLGASAATGALAATDYATTGCARFGQPEFVFSSGGDATLVEPDAQWFKSTLESMVASGEKFKGGETMLIGPVVLKIEPDADGRLRLWEPDMVSMPFKYVDSVARTLKLVRRQRDTVASVGDAAEMRFAPLHRPLLLAPGGLQAKTILLRRTNAGGTGWILSDAAGPPAAADTSLQPVSVYQAALSRPEILDFLALPGGYSVAVSSRQSFAVFKDGKPRAPAPGSYLDRLSQPLH